MPCGLGYLPYIFIEIAKSGITELKGTFISIETAKLYSQKDKPPPIERCSGVGYEHTEHSLPAVQVLAISRWY